MPPPEQQVCPVCRGLPFVFISKVVVASLTFRILGLEEEVAASHLEVDDLHRRLNNLEGHHKALARTALDTVRVEAGGAPVTRLSPVPTVPGQGRSGNRRSPGGRQRAGLGAGLVQLGFRPARAWVPSGD
jgi:hypothetical protein